MHKAPFQSQGLNCNSIANRQNISIVKFRTIFRWQNESGSDDGNCLGKGKTKKSMWEKEENAGCQHFFPFFFFFSSLF